MRYAVRTALMVGILVGSAVALGPTAAAQTGEANAAPTAEDPTNAPPSGVAADLAPTPTPTPRTQRTLQVGVAGSPPFVFRREGQDPVGPSVEIWELIAQQEGWEYELRVLPSAQAAVDQVESGALDVAIGPISITAARANQVAFSQPYWQADLAIMALPGEQSVFSNAKIMNKLGKGLGVLFGALCVVGLLMMLAERKAQSFTGFGEAVWFALVTMTTVGYGDFAPVTRVGRVIAGAWMLFAMFFGASLTAQIATALTLAELNSSSISSADDLERKRVATKQGSTALQFALGHGATPVATEDLTAAVEALIAGRADAVVFDRPALQYQRTLQATAHPDAELVIAEAGYEAQGYGFAFHTSSPLRRAANVVLLGLHEQGTLDEIGAAWISGERTPSP